MRLTRRGKAVIGVMALAAGAAVLSGPRALNAVLIPGVVALATAYLQLRRADPPRVAREVPPDDHVDRTHPVRLFFGDADGPRPDEEHGLSRPFTGVVDETVGDGLSAHGTSVETVVGIDPVEYEVTYDERGQRVLGPASVTVRDVLGLAETDLSTAETDTVLVYPAVHAIAGAARRDLRALHETGVHSERREFDRLREYDRGDSLRDIHWKSTAKRDDLIVKEFAAEAETEAVSLAVGAEPTPAGSAADGMAEATASLVLALVEDGVPVDVHLADGTLTVGPDRGTQVRLLERLAVAGPGRIPTDDADISVYGEADRVRVTVGGSETAFADLVAPRPASYEVSRSTTTGPVPDAEEVTA